MWKYSSPDNDVVIKSRIKLVGNVARMPKKEERIQGFDGKAWKQENILKSWHT
jgi:hypothetical protein